MKQTMKRRFFSGILLLGFLLFVSCKSSLYDLCPNLFSKAEVSTSSVPSCHESSQATKSHKSPLERDCQCPLSFQDYTLDSKGLEKISSILQVSGIIVGFPPVFHASHNKSSLFAVAYGRDQSTKHDPSIQFLASIKLII